MSFDIVYETDNLGVVGWDHDLQGIDFGPGYSVATLNDDSDYDWLNANVGWPPYALFQAPQSLVLVDAWPTGAQEQQPGFWSRILGRAP